MTNGHGHAATGLERLLDLDGFTAEIGDRYRVSFRARQVPPSAARPHGIQYALTLHTPGGRRILGYDNAHRPRLGTGPKRRSATPVACDHLHRGTRIFRYEFRTPGDLPHDFWADVEAEPKKEGVR